MESLEEEEQDTHASGRNSSGSNEVCVCPCPSVSLSGVSDEGCLAEMCRLCCFNLYWHGN